MAASSSSCSSSVPPNVGNMMVVTHVVPTAPNNQQPLSEPSQRFKRGQPKALGVVQIMIGVVILTFGIATASYHSSVGVLSGIFVWGALIYIAAGSVAVAAENSFTNCLINASLALNITAAIVAGTGVILYGIDSVSGGYHYSTYYYRGFSVVLTVFQFLEFVVSLTSAGYACHATCSCCGGGQQVMFQTVNSGFTAQAPLHIQISSVHPAQPPPQGQQFVFQTVDGAFAAQAPPYIQMPSVLPAQPPPQEGPHYKSPDMSSTLPPAYQPAS